METKALPAPGNEHKLLNVFVGMWNTEGHIKYPVKKISGTDSYEWLPGGFFLAHHVDVRMGDEEVKGMEIIGYDSSIQAYLMHSFDNFGNYTTMKAVVSGNTWTLTGDSQRCTVIVSNNGNTLTATWEQLSNGSAWLPWMDVKLTKVNE